MRKALLAAMLIVMPLGAVMEYVPSAQARALELARKAAGRRRFGPPMPP
jgi:hypothetical protein